jgi:aspartyl-tRNA(Asn)/glutamyl-tRNA(Gln) amidotransferase subunit A
VTLSTLRLTAERILALLDAREVSCVEVAKAYLDRIEAADGEVGAFLHTHPEATLARARRFDEEGRAGLAGLPVAFKDLFSTRGVPTTAGSRILEGFHPVENAFVVDRCLDAGLVSLGKLNMDEFAMGSSTEHSAYQRTTNPWAPDRVPGGSSGGSAAAVAAGLAPLALGTDTGGSIRQPAAFTGTVGLKPTYGAVSRSGVVAFASSLDQVGTFALTCRDAALLYRTIAVDDPRDATQVGPREPVALPDREDLGGVRIGVPRDQLTQGVDPGVLDLFEAALTRLADLGAEIVDVELPHAGHGLAAYYLIAPAEASANLARYDGVRYGLRVDAADVHSMYERTRDAGFGAEVKRRVLIGTYALSAGYFDAFYGQAQRVRTLIIRDYAAAFASSRGVDAIATPTAPTTAFPFGQNEADPLAMYANDVLTIPLNLAGLPGLSVPMGLDDGLPAGLQLAGPAFSENALLAIGHAFERSLDLDPVPVRLREEAR